MSPRPRLSVVVPVFDEEQNLALLQGEIVSALEPTGEAFEVVYVDDRSRDGSFAVLRALQRADPRIRIVRFRARAGQTAALAAGFDHARGDLVVTLDADLQNDPADIPRLLAELERGADVVAGWRRDRHDGFLLRRLPSRLANRLVAWVTGVAIHDTGCTLKVFRREVVLRLPIYAEQHRFLPAISAATGARVRELVVNHRPRRFGRSKYGLGRAVRVLLDLLTLKLIGSFSQRPLSYFGLLVLPFAAAGTWTAFSLFESFEGLLRGEGAPMREMLAGMLFLMTCAYFLMLGLLAELAVKASGMHRDAPHRPMTHAPEGRGTHAPEGRGTHAPEAPR